MSAAQMATVMLIGIVVRVAAFLAAPWVNGSRGGRKSSSSNKGTLVPVRKYKLYNKHKAIIAAADAVLVAHVREAIIAMFMVCMR